MPLKVVTMTLIQSAFELGSYTDPDILGGIVTFL